MKKNEVKIHFYRNATMKINYAGFTILTDPMLADKQTLPGYLNPTKLVNPTSSLTASKEEVLSGVDFLLMSHTHIPESYDGSMVSDHMDPVALETLDKNMPIYLSPYDKAGMKKQGFINLNVIEDEKEIGDLNITRFEGLHVDVQPLEELLGHSSGYILSAKDYPKILWLGDTLYIDSIKEVIEKNNPDIIIVHSGGAYLPLDEKGNKANLLLGSKETIEIAKLAPSTKIIAIHLDSLDHCPVTKEDLRNQANESGVGEDRLIIPQNGEMIILS